MLCVICKKNLATAPNNVPDKNYCAGCFRVRMRQLHTEENKFHLLREVRTAAAEKHFLYHDEVTEDNGCCGIIHTMLVPAKKHLDIGCYLFDNLPWEDKVTVLYDQGVESNIRYLDLLTGFIEIEVVAGWPCRSWSAEINLVKGDPLYLDSRDPIVDVDGPIGDEPESGDPER